MPIKLRTETIAYFGFFRFRKFAESPFVTHLCNDPRTTVDSQIMLMRY